MAEIRLDHVSKRYMEERRLTYAVRDISLTVEQGEFVFLIGSSGAGKTTLLQLMSGEIAPDEGTVLLNGHTHVPACTPHGSYVYMNPGSVSIPKGGSRHSYMTLENGLFQWKDLEGTVYQEYQAQ